MRIRGCSNQLLMRMWWYSASGKRLSIMTIIRTFQTVNQLRSIDEGQMVKASCECPLITSTIQKRQPREGRLLVSMIVFVFAIFSFLSNRIVAHWYLRQQLCTANFPFLYWTLPASTHLHFPVARGNMLPARFKPMRQRVAVV